VQRVQTKYLILREVGVHLVSIEVGVVGLADRIVQTHYSFTFQNPGSGNRRKKAHYITEYV
jgi:hypothetical protein